MIFSRSGVEVGRTGRFSSTRRFPPQSDRCHAEEFRTELAIKRHEVAQLTKAEMLWLVLGVSYSLASSSNDAIKIQYRCKTHFL